MRSKLAKLDTIFNYLPKTLRRELNDDDQIRSWALQALRTVNHSQRFIKDISFHDIDNHKVNLPDDVYKIYKVSYIKEQPSTLEILSACGCEAETDSSAFDLETDCLPIYHQLFLSSDLYQSQFVPVAYKKTRLADNYVCNVNWGGCHGFYSLNSTGTVMTFSESTGFVAVEYLAEAKDSDYDFLVPDIPALWNGMSAWIKAKFYEERSIQAEQNSYQLYQQALLESRTWLNDARSIFKLEGINTALHRQMIQGSSRILRAHTLVRHYD